MIKHKRTTVSPGRNSEKGDPGRKNSLIITNTPAPFNKSSLTQKFEKKLFEKINEASIDHPPTQIFFEISSNINPFLSLVPNNSTNPLAQMMLEKFNT